MKIQSSRTVFKAKPSNYAKIDNYVSRSAQPMREDFKWLKEQGVTDIFNFRTMHTAAIDFSEKDVVEGLGMKYHSIPTVSKKPAVENIFKFLAQINLVKHLNGKAHIHCMQGADRTGLYSYIYKMVNNIGTMAENKQEWLKHGLHTDKYPDMMNWADKFLDFKKNMDVCIE